jgi:molybdopterin-guanine dinucleotide biosynthesis protein A
VAERLAGLILAGGRSSRLGREKAVAVWRGAPLIAHVAGRFFGCEGPAVSARLASAAAAWAMATGLPVLPDPKGAPDGPLTGIREGLRWAARLGLDRLAVAPCDTPALPGDLFAQLSARLRPEVSAVVAETPDGLQPLIAILRIDPALRALEQLMAQGAHPPVRTLYAATDAIPVPFADGAPFLNLNRAQDFGVTGGHD